MDMIKYKTERVHLKGETSSEMTFVNYQFHRHSTYQAQNVL